MQAKIMYLINIIYDILLLLKENKEIITLEDEFMRRRRLENLRKVPFYNNQ